MHGGAHIHYHRIEPHYFWWSVMRRNKRTVADILRDIGCVCRNSDSCADHFEMHRVQ
uniref:Uncharacterized protein n=1 Tax=Romanomermis culicivorax TaxID=13658 RepID=A0A915KQG1_ROMCU